jgi:hypothetical protein
MARESSLACVRAGAAPCGTAGLRCALRESDVACAHLTTIVRPAEGLVSLSVCVCDVPVCRLRRRRVHG